MIEQIIKAAWWRKRPCDSPKDAGLRLAEVREGGTWCGLSTIVCPRSQALLSQRFQTLATDLGEICGLDQVIVPLCGNLDQFRAYIFRGN